MCGRFSRFTGQDVIESQFNVDISRVQVSLEYNIAPSDSVPVIYRENPIVLDSMEWGFLAFFSKERYPAVKPINARAESLSSGMFSYSFEKRRCLVPSNGFYEWKQTQFGKVPYFISLPGNELFAFAGIYSIWKEQKQADPIYSFSIITTEPNNVTREIHDRMPVILPRDAQEIWLHPESQQGELMDLLKPYAGEMAAYSVSTYVNSPNNKGEYCIKHVEPQFAGVDKDQTNLDDYF